MMNVPFVDLQSQYAGMRSEIDEAIRSVIGETAFIGGKYVKEFEKVFGELYGVRNVISCANGTDSLYIIMKMLNIGRGDEVITVANSWISSSETITQTGAKPVFVDIDPVYYSIDESKIREKITVHTKAIIAVHLQGQMCQIDSIRQLCEEHRIHLIEDCAQSHFSTLNGIRAGLTGIAGSFSFYPGKNLGAYGDAGCIITNDDELARLCRRYANHGSLSKHKHEVEGINSRMDGLQAAILTAKCAHILEWTASRIKNASLYTEKLKDIPQVVVPAVRPNSEHSYHLYVIRAERRDELVGHLKAAGVETAVHYPRILPNLEAYAYLGTKPQDFPVALAYEKEILSLPMYPELTVEQIDYVVEHIRSFYAQ
jgi:dTDP-4-amino-4,6-dideoxygalactose transaminase